MSFFKKPKKNIRRRPFGSNENDESAEEHGSHMDVDDEEQSMAQIREKIAKAKKKEQRKQTLLSFEEEFNEGELRSVSNVLQACVHHPSSSSILSDLCIRHLGYADWINTLRRSCVTVLDVCPLNVRH